MSERGTQPLQLDRVLLEAAERAGTSPPAQVSTTLLDALPDAIVVVDREGRIVLVNRRAEALFDYPRRELEGRPAELLVPERSRKQHVRLRAEYLAAPRPRPMGSGLVLKARRRDGREIPVEICLSPLESEGGPLVIAAIRDVSERRAAEQRWRAIFDRTYEFVGLLAPDGTMLEVNSAALTFGGLRREDVVGRPFWETGWWAISGATRAELRAAVARAAAGEFVRYEVDVRGAGDEVATLDFSLKPVFDEQGAVVLLIPEGRDITERKRAEEERARLAAIVGASQDAIIGKTPDGIITSWNPGAERLYGYAADEVIGRSVGILVPPDQPDELPGLMARLRHGERTANYETVRVCRDGRRVELSLSLSPLRDSAGRLIGAATIARDISERNAAERRLQELVASERAARRQAQLAETNYRALVRGVSDAIVVCDEQAKYVDANGAACSLSGYLRAELLELPAGALAAAGSPWAAAAIARADREGSWRGEFELRRKDGSTVAVEGTVTTMQLPNGRRHVAILRDVSQRRALERLQREFLAMAGHELRNPLASVKGYAQLLQRRGVYDERAVETIRRQADQLDRLVGDLLDASRVELGRLDLQRAELDLVAEAWACVEQARGQAPAHRLRVEAPPGPLVVWADRDRVAQVFTNLLTNAVKYSPTDGEILVRVEALGAEARVAVRDAGVGISPEALARLFDRFYRADASAERAGGLGLGLYITKGLVEAHGGRIWAESKPGSGSTFCFTLPLLRPAG